MIMRALIETIKAIDEVEVVNYFKNKNIHISSSLLKKAIYLAELNGEFEFIAVKVNGNYECIYVSRINN